MSEGRMKKKVKELVEKENQLHGDFAHNIHSYKRQRGKEDKKRGPMKDTKQMSEPRELVCLCLPSGWALVQTDHVRQWLLGGIRVWLQGSCLSTAFHLSERVAALAKPSDHLPAANTQTQTQHWCLLHNYTPITTLPPSDDCNHNTADTNRMLWREENIVGWISWKQVQVIYRQKI